MCPNHPTGDEDLRAKVMDALDVIRPALQSDGGDIEFVDLVDGVVQVRLMGACHGCPMAQATLTYGVERAIKERIPEIIRVEAVS